MKSLILPDTYRVTFIDSNDGSGDGILPLPDEVLKNLNWEIGDLLTIEVLDNREIIISKNVAT